MAHIKIKLVKSIIGRPEKHRKVVRSLGLRKTNQTVEKEDTASIRGMIQVVPHLLKVEEIQ
jgi:large subunit ribosomal protein L30